MNPTTPPSPAPAAAEALLDPQSLVDGLAWPESPRWHDGALWFSDVHHFRVMRVVPGQAAEVAAEAPGRPAGLGFMPDGRLLLATALDRCLWWVRDDGTLDLAADLSALAKGLLNDMVVDAAGRAWVGDTGFDLLKGEPEVPGSLLSWTAEGSARIAAADVRFPNGLAITPDGGTLYLAETFGRCISAFDITADGSLARRRRHAELPERPDGLCLDAEGGLWVPLLWAQAFHRIDAQGRTTHVLARPGQRAISCVLAGADRRELYLGVCEIDDSNPQAVRRYGALLRTRVTVPGAGIP